MTSDHYRNIFKTGKRSEVIAAGEELLGLLGKREQTKTKRAKFEPPTLEQVKTYMTHLGLNGDNPQSFLDHYESNGWKVGPNPMVSWQAACRTWKRNHSKFNREDKPKPKYKDVSLE